MLSPVNEKNVFVEPPEGERLVDIDILKTIGLAAIILAHVDTGNIIFQLRNFDVPLMVLCSGALFTKKARTPINYRKYVQKRFVRLAVPSWTFLLIYFTAIFIIESKLGRQYPYEPVVVVKEFFFRSQVVGLWIIRVFILVSFIAPLTLQLCRDVKELRRFLVTIILCYWLYELSLWVSQSYFPEMVQKVLNKSLFEMASYGCVFALGFASQYMRKYSVILLGGIFLALFILMAYFFHQMGNDIWTQPFKHPPRFYYLAYALGISLLFLGLLRDKKIRSKPLQKTINFIGTSSLWIYLWHWLFLYYGKDMVQLITSTVPDGTDHFFTAYLFILVTSVTITFVQKRVFGYFVNRLEGFPGFQRTIKVVFLQ